jgi:hypothetical protein
MSFQRVFCLQPLVTFINEDGIEKKKGANSTEDHPMLNVLPLNWTKAIPENNIDLRFGCMVQTGVRSGITVLDFDDMGAYDEACEIYKKLKDHYTVRTRRGMHVYFEYDKSIDKYVSAKYPGKVDTQNDNKGVFGAGTTITRYNGEIISYIYVPGGYLQPMPDVLREKCTTKVIKGGLISSANGSKNNINYDIDVTEDELRDLLKQLEIKRPDFFDDYSEWIKFTGVMKTLDKKEMWDEFSKRHEHYNYRKNMKEWNKKSIVIHVNYLTKLLGIAGLKRKKVEKLDSLVLQDYCVKSNRKYVKINHFNTTDVIAIQAKTGGGKTTCVATEFAEYHRIKPHITLLSITNLISLSKQQQITFKKQGVRVSSYLESKINPSLIMAHNSVICINSLHKLHDCDFRHKVIYIDEVHALVNSLTHNNTIVNQRLVMNTLLRAIKTCHKVIVSDAHIYDSTMHLLSERIYDGKSTYRHFINEHNKFQDVPAIRYNDENDMFDKVREKVLNGESFSFACDSKDVITKWYTLLYDEASIETQSRMILYTSDTDSEICEDWKDKIIFYSPKISTGVDVTVIDHTDQFIYITGKSVSPITLYQMSTRTRNMKQLNYYSCAKDSFPKYTSREDCAKQTKSEFDANQSSISRCRMNIDVEALERMNNEENADEDIFRNIFIENTYLLDYFKTGTMKFFEDELKNAGFKIIESGKNVECGKLDSVIVEKMNEMSNQIKDDKYEQLLKTFSSNDELSTNSTDDDEDDEEVKEVSKIPTGVSGMLNRVKILKLDSEELIEEYRDLVEDEYKFDHFLNYNRLNKTLEHCENKLKEVVSGKMLTGVHNNVWNKIKYVHMLARNLGITGVKGQEDNLFNFGKIVAPDVNDKEIQKLINSIKILYRKRDTVNTEDYTGEDYVKLYKFMLESLIKKLGLIKSKQSRSKEERGKILYHIDVKSQKRYDKLIEIMNPVYETTGDCFDEEEE